ncbi:NAD-dependent succinate-semialdehyde dehydrogenase [Tatumella citrea]|uniref:Succinate-semialdehyde dehydrogenase (NADP(+)) n=1 Tax=Tatumella citrea TaxID=53336 RepID=A0A1Y0L8P7_TATCI|nr:NAD-dependent succinate-semialdehyde dehydrogenase [Tatumella citrea]ARU94404.1 succinate-semialdehyde dehydrogenase (NADP(+)) [Tatumella citrea]ARU98443.1 succinate-semialdehyde dehydrogenase (NADP(+)) [Tatumella citrea]
MLKLRDPSLFRETCLLAGEWRSAADGATLPVNNPATLGIIANVPRLAQAEAELAVVSAQQAFVQWRQQTASQRCALLRRWFELIVENREDLAAIMTAEQGKPLAESRGEVSYAASFIDWFAEEGKRIYGDVIPPTQPDKRLLVIKQPVGVCAAITPWNFPAAMITRKAAPALAAGCVMIVKPAEQTPLTALALGELAVRAGIPAGVLQVITGDAKVIGEVLTRSDVVRKLSFTGSTAVGRLLMAQCAPTIKRLSLELGGNAPFIVFDDADLEAAVDGAIQSKYRNAGQTCVCTNRFLVQSGIYDRFAQRLAEKVAALKTGDGTAEGVQIGPLIDEDAVAKVQQHLQDAQQKGGKVIIGGERLTPQGLFITPAIIVNAERGMLIAREETFGPVAPLFRFDTEQQAIEMANDTEFGLAAYFYTESSRRMWRVSEALEYGMVGHNTGLISNEVAPFGGIKQSGIGREGSKYGIEEYLEIKYLCTTTG